MGCQRQETVRLGVAIYEQWLNIGVHGIYGGNQCVTKSIPP